jgi:hypothetical protein
MAKDQLQFAEGVTGEGITALSKMNEGASTGDAANFDLPVPTMSLRLVKFNPSQVSK